MKYSTAFVPAFAVASLAASIETRQSKLPSSEAIKKLRWTEGTATVDCGAWGIDEYTCGTELFCQKINNPYLLACENPRGWRSYQECKDGHDAKPSREQCTKLRRDAFDQCREKSECKECETKGQEVFERCMGIQKFQSPKERAEALRAKGCPGF